MINRSLTLIEKPDLKINQLKHAFFDIPKMNSDRRRKIADQKISLQHGKVATQVEARIQVAEQLEENVEIPLSNLSKHIGKMINHFRDEHRSRQKDSEGFGGISSGR